MPPDKRSMTPLTLSAYTLVTANGRGIGAVSRSLRDRRTGLRPCNFEDALLKTYIGRVDGLEDFSWKRIGAVRLPEQPAGMARSATRRIHGGGGRSQTTVRLRPHCRRHGNQHVRNSRNGTCLCATGSPDRQAWRRFHGTLSIHTQHVFVGTLCPGMPGAAWARPGYFDRLFFQCQSVRNGRPISAGGLCDAAIVGGVDSLCLTTLYGFSALQLLSAALPSR